MESNALVVTRFWMENILVGVCLQSQSVSVELRRKTIVLLLKMELGKILRYIMDLSRKDSTSCYNLPDCGISTRCKRSSISALFCRIYDLRQENRCVYGSDRDSDPVENVVYDRLPQLSVSRTPCQRVQYLYSQTRWTTQPSTWSWNMRSWIIYGHWKTCDKGYLAGGGAIDLSKSLNHSPASMRRI